MLHDFRIYLKYFAQFLKARLSYKWDFLSGLVATALSSLGGVLFVYLLIDGKTIPSLKGWSRDQVLFIYGYSLIASSLFGLISSNLTRFSERYIIQGQFDRVLLRPLNTLAQVLFESFNLEAVGNFILGVSLVLYAGSLVGIVFTFVDYVWLFVSAVSGGVILTSVFVVLSTVSFHFEDRLGLVPPMYNLVMFSRYPLPIFNKFIQILLSFIIPFAFVSFYPATYFFEAQGYEVLCYMTPLVAVISILIASLFWVFGVSRYESTGS